MPWYSRWTFLASIRILKLSIEANAYTSCHEICCGLQYHKAAHIGQERSRKAQIKLFDYTGFAMLTYTIKQGKAGFEPVGEEDLAGKMRKGNEAMIFICDKDGYAKAQSRPMPVDQTVKEMTLLLGRDFQKDACRWHAGIRWRDQDCILDYYPRPGCLVGYSVLDS